MIKQFESAKRGTQIALEEFLPLLKFNSDGLVAAIAQQYDSGEVLMMAWMNLEALQETLQTQRVCYFSRSRGKLWRKGESSGQTQQLKELRVDCDGDAVLLMVDQLGPACHTGRRHCFYHVVQGDHVCIDSDPLIDPKDLYRKK